MPARDATTRILDSGPARTLLLDPTTAPPTVVKRFHHPRPWSALFDRRRARREYALLRRLFERGLSVPRPLDVTRGARGWEVRMEWIADAEPLGDVLRGAPDGREPAGGWPRLLGSLGRLLARMQQAGVEHPDLHPGNALVAADGRAYLLDFHTARTRPATTQSLEQGLVACTAAARELLPADVRARFLLGWFRELAPGLRRDLLPLPELARTVERAARGHRRASVERNSGRWNRTSSRCVVHGDAPDALVARRGLDEEAARALEHSADCLVLRGEDPAVLQRRWENAARLEEHRIPGTAPLARAGGADPWAAFALPATRGEASPAALGRLLGTLHDRGLGVDVLAREDVVASATGEAHLLPPRRLHVFEPHGREPRAGRFAALERLVPTKTRDRAFLAAYLEAFRGWPEEEHLLRSRLGEIG